MKKFLVITIDVEPDCSRDWSYSNPLTFQGINQGIGKILHPLFSEYNMVPTYLLNNVVMEDANSVEFLNNLKMKYELGTHLHPEFLEPEKKYYDYAGKSARSNSCFYSPEIEKQKLINITSLFEKNFGYSPTSFRAGRFSAGPNTISCLKELGYKVDTSVTPHIKWNDKTREQAIDFSNAPDQPYFIKNGTTTIKSEMNGGLLEVPVTIGLLRRNSFHELVASGLGIRRKINWNRRVWLRPAFADFESLKLLVQNYSDRYAGNKVLVFNMMFHNVEVLPGLSPYTLTQQSCDQYIKTLRNFLAYCNSNDILGIRLSDTCQIMDNKTTKKMDTAAVE